MNLVINRARAVRGAPRRDEAAPRRVLVITYTFPPVGGAGVQRVTKFTKYLPKHGWIPTVLTVSNPSVPVYDHSLEADVSTETNVIRAASWEPGYRFKSAVAGSPAQDRSWLGRAKSTGAAVVRSLASFLLQPDPQILWYRNAVSVGKQHLRMHRYDAIAVTAPPFSTFLVGAALAKAGGLPLLLDYRDEWTISNNFWENKRVGWLPTIRHTALENRILRAASAVVATTRSSAAYLAHRCREAAAEAKVTCIYNGYDRDDFAKIAVAERDRSLFRIVYTGTLWNLTSIEPLLQAVRVLSDSAPHLARRLELVLVGRRVGRQIQHVEALKALPCRVVELDYIDHKEALGILASADAACLLLTDTPEAQRVVPAKLFEYVACGVPILALTPRGETWDLLADVKRASAYPPSDTTGIVEWLKNAIAGGAESAPKMTPAAGCRFDRDSQTKQLAELLDAMVLQHQS